VASDVVIEGYAGAMLAAAEAEGAVDRVTDEIFGFARSMEATPALRDALTTESLPIENRLAVIADVLGGRTHRVTPALIGLVVEAGHARDLGRIAEVLATSASVRREHVLGEARSAVALDEAQVERLSEQLSRATGRTVDVKVVIDPSVIGGVVARVGDLVFDGSIAGRLDEARHHLGAER
jgi:F-type H+-transporting ATPase subunit delta